MSIYTCSQTYPLGYIVVSGSTKNRSIAFISMITTARANTIVLNTLASVGNIDPHQGLVELRNAKLGNVTLFESDDQFNRFAYLLSLEVAAGTAGTID